MQHGIATLFALLFGRAFSSCDVGDDLTFICDSFDEEAQRASSLIITQSCDSFNQSLSYQTASLTLKCPISDLPFFWLASFPNLTHLSIPVCNESIFTWQLFTPSRRDLDVRHSCPLTCDCSNSWIHEPKPFLYIFELPKLPIHLPCGFKNCTPPNATLTPSTTHIRTRLGEPLELSFAIDPPALVLDHSEAPRKFFDWARQRDEPPFNESITPTTMELTVEALDARHLGQVDARCWHCELPLTTRVMVEFDVPMTAILTGDPISPYHDHLQIRGFPLKNVTIAVLFDGQSDGRNYTLEEQRELSFFNGSVKVQYFGGAFNFRTYDVDYHPCAHGHGDCAHGHDEFTLRVCERDAACHELLFVIGSYDVPELSDEETSLLPPLWLLMLLPLFALSACFAAACLLARQRKFAVKLRELRRRESRCTEETRLEERTSMASDYTNVTIPSVDVGDLEMHEKIGAGAFGEVFRATLASNGLIVAVKIIKDADEKELQAREASLLARLAHENVVRLFGTTRTDGRLLLVLEMCTLGDLRTYVSDRRPRPGQYTQFPPALTPDELVSLVRQVVTGMAYLVEMGVVHRDLAARNCLVTGPSDRHTCLPSSRPRVTVKISDFGMSRRLYAHAEYYRMQTATGVLPVRWLPPEALNTGVFNLHTDVWALGITIWEVFSYGDLPFADLAVQELLAICMAGMRPPQPPACPDDVYDLCLRCWEMTPEDRITPQQALMHPALRRPGDLPMSNSVTESIDSAWTQASHAPLLA